MKNIFYLAAVVSFLTSCGNHDEVADAYGNFTTTEVIISAETAGQILYLPHSEGQKVQVNDVAAIIDTVQSFLSVKELEAKRVAARAKIQNINAQIAVYEKQRAVADKELQRFGKMKKDGAATQKQLDDLQGQIDIIDSQIRSVKSNIAAANAEITAISTGIDRAEYLLDRGKIKFPSSGTILNKYCEAGELVSPGKAIYKLALLDTMELKAYISGNQLSSIKIGQDVSVGIDTQDGALKYYTGTISWIASEAEFTPKNIQTKEERLTQVYAFKIRVPNDGAIKINMPGEVRFN